MEETKICKKCGRELPLSEFYKQKGRKDGHQVYCKGCLKEYYKDNRKKILEYHKLYDAEHKEEKAEYLKQWIEKHKKEVADYKKQYGKQYYKQYYSTIKGYCKMIRCNNIRADREQGRIGEELPSNYPTIKDYIELLQKRDFYDGKQYNFNEMGLDRIDNDKPHTLDNVVPCTTEHNIQRGVKSFEEFCSLFK